MAIVTTLKGNKCKIYYTTSTIKGIIAKKKERRIYMFIDIEEMKSVLYKYQMDEIAENDDSIIQEAILAAVAEVRAP